MKPEDTLPLIAETLPDTRVFFVNGAAIVGLDDPAAASELLPAGDMTKTLLALAALRLADRGLLDLKVPVSTLVPEVVPPSPWEAPITVTHLLQETAGFASPPLTLSATALETPLAGARLRRFAIRQRSPGQLSAHDPVGWALLVVLLEQVSGQRIAELLRTEVTQPMAIPDAAVTVRHRRLAGETMALDVSMSPQALAQLAITLTRNRNTSSDAYLTRGRYNDLIAGTTGHRLHPEATISSYGLSVRRLGVHTWLEPLNAHCNQPLALAAFPREGAAILIADGTPACTRDKARTVALAVARALFPGRVRAPDDGPPLAPPSEIEGTYVRADRSPSWLPERLAILLDDKVRIFGYRDSGMLVRFGRDEPVRFNESEPYLYRAQAPAREGALLFSPFMLGGYMVAGETVYRRADILGAAGTLKNALPWALLVIASAVIYAYRPRSRAWRYMALFSLVGSGLVGLGVYLDMTAWPSVIYDWGLPWLVTLWRTGLNVGLMLLLALPMLVLSFARRQQIPSDFRHAYIAPHLTLVAAASLMVFFTLIMWGVAGTFAPY